MNYRSISDEIWKDAKFKKISTKAKLAFLFLLTTPDFNFAGIHYCPTDQMAVYTRMSNKDCYDALLELSDEGMVRVSNDYVIMINHLRHNKCTSRTHSTKLVKDLHAVPSAVFNDAMRVDYVKDAYLNACITTEIEPKTISAQVIDQDTDQASKLKKEPRQRHTKGKAVIEDSLISEPEPAEIQRLRGYVAAIVAEYPDCKWAKSDLTGEQYKKLLAKFGIDKLTVMQKVYFEWKFGRKDKPKTTDFGTLNVCSGWVSEKADQLLGAGYKSEEPKTDKQEWTLPFAKPADWDKWSIAERRAYVVNRNAGKS